MESLLLQIPSEPAPIFQPEAQKSLTFSLLAIFIPPGLLLYNQKFLLFS